MLIAAREIDQQYEWSAHEPAGRRQGLEQSVIDVVKYNRDVTGLTDKDATMITFGRTLLREHRISSELWQKMVGHFHHAWERLEGGRVMFVLGDWIDHFTCVTLRGGELALEGDGNSPLPLREPALRTMP